MRCLLAVVVLSVSTGASLLTAQTIPGPPPTASECQASARALAGGARDGTGWESLPGCGKTGGVALARAFDGARFETDAAYLQRLYGAMASLRDPAVFATALSVMQDLAASAPARATAILIAVAQHDNALSLPLNLSFTDVISPVGSARCRLVPTSDASYRSSSPLPADYRQQLGKAILRVDGSPDTPDLVRSFVQCARPALTAVIADAVPTSEVRLTYVCGNRFRVENQSTESVKVSWKVSGTRDRADLVVPSKGESTFTTEKRGPTSLYYRGKLVGTAANGGQACG